MTDQLLLQQASRQKHDGAHVNAVTRPDKPCSQPRVVWKSKNPLSGSRNKPIEQFPLAEPYPFDLDWRTG